MPIDPITRRYSIHQPPGYGGMDPITHRYANTTTTTDDVVGGLGTVLDLPFEIISTLVRETGRDLEGVLNTGVAFGGSLANLLGSNVPYTLEDLESRDIRGTLMLGALLASGGVTHLAKGIPAFAKLAQAAEAAKIARFTPGTSRFVGAGSRMALTGGVEVLAGATFGMLRPLENDEGRIKAVFGDAALFGAFGAGASLTKSAFMATLGIPLLKIGRGIQAQASGQALEAIAQGNIVQELIGVKLRNPKTGDRATLFRHFDEEDTFSIIYEQSKGKAGFTQSAERGTVGAGESLRAPLERLASEGFIEPMGPAGIMPSKQIVDWDDEVLAEMIPADAFQLLKQQQAFGGPKLKDLLEGIKPFEYRSVRQAAQAKAAEYGIETHLAAEYLTDSVTELGTFRFGSQGLKEDAVKYLPGLTTEQRRRLIDNPNADPEILRRAITSGIANIETVKHGLHVRDWIKELIYNDLAPTNMSMTIVPNDDLFAKWFFTTRSIAKMHPEIYGAFRAASEFEFGKKRRNQLSNDALYQLQLQLEPFGPYTKGSKTSTEVKRVLDAGYEYAYAQHKRGFFNNSASVFDDMNAMARRYSKDEAERLLKTRPDPEINYDHVGVLVEGFAKLMDDMGEELVQVGRLDKANMRPGYFSIMNNLMGYKWRAEVTTKAGKPLSLGWFATETEAKEAAANKIASNPKLYTRAFTQADDMAIPMESLLPLQRHDVRKVLQKMGDESLWDIRSGWAYERQLNTRDFERSDVFDIAEAYLRSGNRAIALAESGFSNIARVTADSISSTKPTLHKWFENYVARVSGKPSRLEVQVQNFLDSFGRSIGYEFKPNALKRWTIGLRQWESFSRLFGVNSPLVNLTQIAINTYPKLGFGYTAKAIKDVFAPGKEGGALRERIRQLMHEFDAGLELLVPFAEASGSGGAMGKRLQSQTFKGLIKRKEYGDVVNRAAMFMFNGVEEMNRITTWWGAYSKAIAEGTAHKDAGRIATKTMFETQFDYSVANMPEILSTPIGALLGQFKSFFINEVEFIAQMSPAEMRRFAVAMQALGGSAALFNIPGPDLLSSAKSLFFDTTIEEDLKLEEVSELENLSPTLSRFISFGAPGLVNVSVSDYVGLGGFGDITQGILGPFGSDVKALKDFVFGTMSDKASGSLTNQEHYRRFLQKTMPSQIRRIMNATQILESGEVRDPYSGKLIYKADDRLEEAFQAALGPPTVELQQQRVMDHVMNRVKERYNSTRASFSKDIARATIEGRRDEARDLQEKARAQGYTIDQTSINYWVRELQTTAAERRFRRTPVDLRTSEEYLEYFTINGVLPEEVEKALDSREQRRQRGLLGLYP